MLMAGCFVVETISFRERLPERLAYPTFGMAELVPRNRTALAGVLRMCGVGLMGAILAARAVQLITPAG